VTGARRITEEGEDDMAPFSWCGKPQARLLVVLGALLAPSAAELCCVGGLSGA